MRTVRDMDAPPFRIVPLPADHAAGLRDAASPADLRVADESPGYPCRRCLRDASIGDELILVAYDQFGRHGPGLDRSPYVGAGPVFIHRHDCGDDIDPDEVPVQLTRRQLSVRAFDGGAMMLDGRVVDGRELRTVLDELGSRPDVSWVHVHNAGPGCFAAAAVRPAPDGGVGI